MKPNIFDIGTKELNQDAFLTWLLRYGNVENSKYFTEDDLLLNQCSKEFIKQLINKSFPEASIEFKDIEAGRQWEKIDVWAQVDNKYLIIIEDKTSSGQHSDQLKRYKEIAEKWCEEQIPKYEKAICIYLKTGNEAKSSLKKVEHEGFSIFNRRDFLGLLSKYSAIKNQIFIDFYERLVRLESSVNQYQEKNIGEWMDDDWVGFYQFLDSSMDLCNWYKLNNLAGGFWNAIIEWPMWNGFPVHFQIEQGRIAFKISFDIPETDYENNDQFNSNEQQDRWQNIILEHSRLQFPEIRRPYPYVHRGLWRTVAFIDRDDWLGRPENKLNREEVIRSLERYRDFIKNLAESIN